jgi:hypothetical protein
MLTIPRPCPAPWEEMTGDDRRRRCARCDCDVHDVSILTRAEAAALVAARACVQVRLARPGWLRFRDGLVATALFAGLAGCVRGKVAPPPEDFHDLREDAQLPRQIVGSASAAAAAPGSNSGENR